MTMTKRKAFENLAEALAGYVLNGGDLTPLTGIERDGVPNRGRVVEMRDSFREAGWEAAAAKLDRWLAGRP